MNTDSLIDLAFWQKFAKFWSPVDLVKQGRGKDLFVPVTQNVDRKVIMDEQDIIDETGDLDDEIALL